MAVFGSVGHLIGLSIQSERALERLYQQMSERFRHAPDVAAFWSSYALEEVGHARWLEGLREKISEAQRDQPTDPEIIQLAERGLSTPMDLMLEKIQDLQQAFDVANELEHAEINVVFEFLINHFATDASASAFLRSQLRDHVLRLENDFPAPYQDALARRTVKAQAG